MRTATASSGAGLAVGISTLANQLISTSSSYPNRTTKLKKSAHQHISKSAHQPIFTS